MPARGYFDLADLVVTYEGPFADYATRLAQAPDWLRDSADRTAHLVYAASLAQAALDLRLHGARRAPLRDVRHAAGTRGAPPPPYLREEAERRSQACP